MIIDLVFDSSTSGAPAGFFTAVNAAAYFWERELVNPVTVTLDVGYNQVDGETIGTSALGESVSEGFVNLSYAHIRGALAGAATSANDQTAVSSLTATDPTNGGSFFVSITQADVLGIQQSPSSTTAGWVGLSSAFPFTFDPTHRDVAGAYDAVGTMEHEMSEAFGRIADSGGLVNGTPNYTILDLFRYASPGNLQLTPGAGTFSINGTTMLLPFNNPSSGNDAGDWTPSVTGDAFGEGAQGATELVSPTDLTLMDVLGFTPAPDASAKHEYAGDGISDFLIQNTNGAVAIGQLANSTATFTTETGLGSEWIFRASGDFLSVGHDQALIENAAGAVVVSDMIGGQDAFTQVAAVGSEWKFVGAGDFLGLDDGDQFLIENNSGAVVVGNAHSGTAAYTAVAGLGPEWSFVGAGDFLGDGRDQFLIENTSGVVAIGEVMGNSVSYTPAAALGPEWKFVGAGDFLGDGLDQFLIENAAGSVVVGEYSGGSMHFTPVASLGSEWKFVDSGDYLGDGHDQFLIENTSGVVVVGDWVGNQIHYTSVTALGSEWIFHG